MWSLEDLQTVAEILGVTVAYLVTDNSDGAHVIELRPRQDSNLQPRDWKMIDGYAGSDSESELMIAA